LPRGSSTYFSFSAALEHRSIENFPVGMFIGKKFDTGEICVEPGDVVAIITDSVTEIFDSRGEELGYRHVEQALMECASRPLCEIVDQIVGRATEFGKVTDDRTLLLLRYC
jgi:serine phosphatase RsbU (regulator of sigma subunit)